MFQCSYCIKEYKYESEKKRHEQSHVPQFECKVCTKKFSFVSALRRHEKQHERKGLVPCTKCGRSFLDETLLKRHIQYAHKGIFTCVKCSAHFSSEIALNTHMKKHKPEAERRFRCKFPNCSKSFNFSHHLKHHQLTHTDDKQHFCKICGKGFIQSYHLKVHLKNHEPEAWLLCTMSNCSKKFTNEYALKRHLTTHRNKVTSQSLLESSQACDTPASSKVAALCTYCGMLKSDQDSEIHLRTCGPKKEQLEPEDLSVTSLGISIKEISDDMDAKSLKIEHNDKYHKSVIKVEHVSQACKCKLLLHDSEDGMEDTESQNDECFCEKVTKDVGQDISVDDFYEPTIYEAAKEYNIDDLQVIKLSDEFKTDDYLNYRSPIKSRCEKCECASLCSDEDKSKELCQFNVPKIECGVDGVVKLKEMFDVDIVRNVDLDVAKNDDCAVDKRYMEQDIESKLEFRDVKCVQFNTCEDVLGECIVSGTGALSDDCLCAKMSADNQQMIVQEIEELTPCPKKSTWFNIKYKVRL